MIKIKESKFKYVWDALEDDPVECERLKKVCPLIHAHPEWTKERIKNILNNKVKLESPF